MEGTGIGDAKSLLSQPNTFSGEQHDGSNWKFDVMAWLQIIGWLLPQDVQAATARSQWILAWRIRANPIKQGASAMR